ncbi:MAG: hypothetical protein IJB76_04425 [Clostridia bacterium]|nr:hypothetical protein [Clostridia bacterium]
MKKKIIALSVAFVLVAVAAIGATLSYLTDQGSALNKFVVGNVEFDAYEYVNHTYADGAGDKDPETTETGGEIAPGDGVKYPGYKQINLQDTDVANRTYTYSNVLPGDEMKKIVEINNNGANDAIFAITVTTNLPDAALTGTSWTAAADAWPDAMPAAYQYLGYDKNGETTNVYKGSLTETTYIFYYYVPAGESIPTLDFSATCDSEVESDAIASYAGSIDVLVTAIQADGFLNDTDMTVDGAETAVVKAIEALHTAIDPINTLNAIKNPTPAN